MAVQEWVVQLDKDEVLVNSVGVDRIEAVNERWGVTVRARVRRVFSEAWAVLKVYGREIVEAFTGATAQVMFIPTFIERDEAGALAVRGFQELASLGVSCEEEYCWLHASFHPKRATTIDCNCDTGC